jgi:hypothetical protein
MMAPATNRGRRQSDRIGLRSAGPLPALALWYGERHLVAILMA